MSLVREEYTDLVADCENNLQTVTHAAELMPKKHGDLYDIQREQLKHAFEWYNISVENLVAFQRNQQHRRQLDSYDFEHLTWLCNSYRQVIHSLKNVYSFSSSEQ